MGIAKQGSFESGGFEKYRKPTRRERFLNEMEAAVPWPELRAVVAPYYPKDPGTSGGRPPRGLAVMLRIHLLQHWFTLSDPGVEDALYESPVLRDKGLLQKGTIVDATIINAPSSTKNQTGERDPEMWQTKKGEQWFFGMKLHIGADADRKAIHWLDVTPANVYEGDCLANLLHGEEEAV